MAHADKLAELTLGTFTPHLEGRFVASVGEFGRETLTLIEAAALKRHAPAGWREPFSLIFRGSRPDLFIAQQILALDHPATGPLEIMLTPVGRFDDGTFRYQAVFT